MKRLQLAFVAVLCSYFTFSQGVDSANYFYQQGMLEKNNRRSMAAFNNLEKATRLKPENIEAQKEFGLAAIELRKYDVAKLAFQKVLTLKQDDPTAIENMANLYFWTKKWNDAIQFATKMQQLKIGKNSNYIIGKSYYELENYGESNKYLAAAEKEDPTNGEIPYLMGKAYVDMSNYKAAAHYLIKAVRLDTTKARWAYECALNLATIPDDKTAIIYYELAAARGYKLDNDYYENLANSYIAAGQAQKGLELFKNLLQKRPSDIALLYNVADIHFRMGKYTEAIEYWDKILGVDKQNARALYMIGLSFQKKGDKQKGMQLCDRAIEMDPSLANMKQKKQMPGM